jgi:hypothetical protein
MSRKAQAQQITAELQGRAGPGPAQFSPRATHRARFILLHCYIRPGPTVRARLLNVDGEWPLTRPDQHPSSVASWLPLLPTTDLPPTAIQAIPAAAGTGSLDLNSANSTCTIHLLHMLSAPGLLHACLHTLPRPSILERCYPYICWCVCALPCKNTLDY